MTPADKSILSELAICECGKGILSVGAARKRAAMRLVNKGWATVFQAGGLFVCIITDEGREALRKGRE